MAKEHSDKKRKKDKSAKETGDARDGHKKSRVSSSSSTAIETKAKGKERASATESMVTLRAPDKRKAYEIGAVLVGAADFDPPDDIAFTLHHQPSNGSTSGQSASLEESLILSGETETMNIVGSNWDLNASIGHDDNVRRDAKGYSGEYVMGVYDAATRSVTLRAAPMFTLRRSVKALDSLSINAGNALSDFEQRVQARRGLGEAFGNRKTKAKARAEDRMKVDTTNMLDVMSTLQDDINASKADTTPYESIQTEAEQARPIPPLNAQALAPNEAYALHDLIPDKIFSLLSTKALEQIQSKEALAKALPVRVGDSDWLKDRMWSSVQSVRLRKKNAGGSSKPAKIEFDGMDMQSNDGAASTGILKYSQQDARSKLKIVYYIALLWGFVTLVSKGRKGAEKEMLLSKMRLQSLAGGEQILDELFARFCEVQRGVKRGVMSNFTQAKLYAYMFALTLHLDDFSVNPAPLAQDLAMPPAKVTDIFRSLGCTPVNKSVPNADGTSSSSQRRIILKCPVELPKPRRGRRT